MNAESNTKNSESRESKGEIKKLRKSDTNKVIFGVCGGLGEYLDLDPTVVRILFAVFTLFGGIGLLAYIIGAILIPAPLTGSGPSTGLSSKKIEPSRNIGVIIGGLLIVIGGLFVLKEVFRGWNSNIFNFLFPFPFGIIWPIILILIGLIFVIGYNRRGVLLPTSSTDQLYRSRSDRKVVGVCAGIGQYFSIDPTVIRIVWVFLTIISGFIPGIVVYFVFSLLIPEEPITTEKTPKEPPAETPTQ